MLGIIHTITELNTQRNGEAFSRNTSYPCLFQAIASCVSDPQSALECSLTFAVFMFCLSLFRVCLEALAPKVVWVLR